MWPETPAEVEVPSICVEFRRNSTSKRLVRHDCHSRTKEVRPPPCAAVHRHRPVDRLLATRCSIQRGNGTVRDWCMGHRARVDVARGYLRDVTRTASVQSCPSPGGHGVAGRLPWRGSSGGCRTATRSPRTINWAATLGARSAVGRRAGRGSTRLHRRSRTRSLVSWSDDHLRSDPGNAYSGAAAATIDIQVSGYPASKPADHQHRRRAFTSAPAFGAASGATGSGP